MNEKHVLFLVGTMPLPAVLGHLLGQFGKPSRHWEDLVCLGTAFIIILEICGCVITTGHFSEGVFAIGVGIPTALGIFFISLGGAQGQRIEDEKEEKEAAKYPPRSHIETPLLDATGSRAAKTACRDTCSNANQVTQQ